MVDISHDTADVCLRELEELIESTRDDEPDPLTDDVFRARNELRDVLDEAEVKQITNQFTSEVTSESVKIIDEDGVTVIPEEAFDALMSEYIEAGGLDE